MRHQSTFVTCALLSLGLVAGCSNTPADQAAAGAGPAAQPAASHAEAGAAGAGAQAPPMAHPPLTTEAQITEVVAPAPGGLTVAKVWADRKSLTGKRVIVRGKVVKYLGAIMGLNWVHIQDGTGSAKDGTHDLTVTTSAEANVGDVVTVTGTVVTDKDFGAGYSYAVMIQGATIAVK